MPSEERARVPTILGGEQVSVAAAAVDDFAAAVTREGSGTDVAGAGRLSVSELRELIGRDGLRQAAVDAGQRPPSDRTVRRWVQQERIPRADVAERARRRGVVERLGGRRQVEEITGRSGGSVRDWQAGRTQDFRGPASDALGSAVRTDVLGRAQAVDKTGRVRRVSGVIEGGVVLRHAGNEDYDYHDTARCEFTLDEEESLAYAQALAAENTAAALAILEANVSDQWFNYQDGYDDTSGWHFDGVAQVSVDWN